MICFRRNLQNETLRRIEMDFNQVVELFLKMMEIILNDDSQRRILYENQTFNEEVKIVLKEHSDTEKSILAVKTVHFKDCNFFNSFNLKESLNNLHYEKIEILFENCYSASESNIYGIDNDVVNLSIINSVFHDFKIEYCILKSITFSRSIFLFRFLVNEGKVENISILNCLGSININDNGYTKGFVRFSNDNLFVKRNEIFELHKKIIDEKQIGSILYLDTNMHFNNINSLHVGFEFFEKDKEGFKINEEPQVNGPNIKQVNYYPSKMDLNQLKIQLNINQSKGLTNQVTIRKGYYESIFIKGESESKVNIEHIHCDKFYMHEFSCQSLKVYELNNRNNRNSKFEMINSNLMNASFVKTMFKDFEKVSFYRNFIEKASFSSCTFPKSILTVENIHCPEKKENDYHGLQYELYRQLKFSLINSQNQIDALEMHQRMYNEASKRNGLSGQDKFILCLNRVSNNHSTSITRAIWLTISMIFILWVTYCFFIPNAPFKLGWYGIENFKIGAYDFFTFTFDQGKVLSIIANPVHGINNLSEVNKTELSSMNYFISFFSRILVAWCYFQFVSAFRKFGKSL